MESSVCTVIPLKYTGDAEEWCMVELQGSLECSSSSMAGLDLGNIQYVKGTPMLEIGAHRLEGKDQKLPKPLLVFQKEEEAMNQEQKVEYKVVGCISKKIIFKNRPKPIIS
mmetsp:Transcript_11429/g.16866  ORF Transcript_11429/g.16866 Transcript_11429/m.16866 type:complete len:111 (-) Transcript_11429:11-343(-)